VTIQKFFLRAYTNNRILIDCRRNQLHDAVTPSAFSGGAWNTQTYVWPYSSATHMVTENVTGNSHKFSKYQNRRSCAW